MQFLDFLLYLNFGLAALVIAAPVAEDGLELLNITIPEGNLTAQGYDPSLEYHDYSTVQIWMGKDKVTVGDTVGQDLYNAVYGALDRNCPARNGPSGCHGIKDANFESRCMKAWPALTVPCTTNIWGISARYENNSIRQLLIAAVAGALQQMTLESIIGPTNCFDMAGIWACNVGDVVRVNFPETKGSGPNYMYTRLYNYWTWYGTWDCCQGNKRERVDKLLDKLGDSIKSQFSAWKDKPFSHDSKCIINGWDSCPQSAQLVFAARQGRVDSFSFPRGDRYRYIRRCI